MNILPPLLLDRSCLVQKISKLSPLIDQLEWIYTNDRAFQAYWSFYANGCKKRQQDIRQRIEQNTDFVQHIKSKKAASFFNILTQNNPSIVDSPSSNKISQKEATNTVYKEFLECFRSPAESDSKEKRCKLEKQSPYSWQREAEDALKRLSRTRNPYDIEQISEKLRKIKQLQSLIQPTPYSDRFKKPRIKYVSSIIKKPSVETDLGIDSNKMRKKSRSKLQKKTLRKSLRKLNEEESEIEPRYNNQKMISNLTKEEKTTKQHKDRHLRKRSRMSEAEEPNEKEDNSKNEIPLREGYTKRSQIMSTKELEQKDKLEELGEKHMPSIKYNSTRMHKRKLSSKKGSFMNDDSEEFKVWYKEFAKRKSKYKKSRLRSLINPHKASLVQHDQSSSQNKNKKHRNQRSRKLKKENVPQHDENKGESVTNIPDHINQFQSGFPKLMKYIHKFEDEEPIPIEEPNLKPYQSVIDMATKMAEMRVKRRRSKIVEIPDKVVEENTGVPQRSIGNHDESTQLHEFIATLKPKFVGKYKGSQHRYKSLIKIVNNDEFPKRERPILKFKESRLMIKTSDIYQRKGRKSRTQKDLQVDPGRKSLGSASLRSRLSSQVYIRDMSKWDQMFRKSDKSVKSVNSVNSLKSNESKDSKELAIKPDLELQVQEENLVSNLGFKFDFRDKEVVYNNPYTRSSFINQISDAFGKASLDIRDQLMRRSSTLLLSRMSTSSLKPPKGLRRQNSPPDIRLRLAQLNQKLKSNIFSHYSTVQRLPEPKPLYISDLVADFLKSRSIEELFKDSHPQMFNPPQVAKPKEPKPTIILPRKPSKFKESRSLKMTVPKTCVNCLICKQLHTKPSKPIQPYMLQMQSQRKKNELRLYYKQMMLQNCQMEKKRQAQRDCNNQLCPGASNFQLVK